MKILCLDFGTKFIGYSVSDEQEEMAFPRGSFSKNPEKKLLERIRQMAREEGIRKIVLGLPLGEENEETPLAKKVKKFGEKLARTLMLPIEYVDEFGTTQEGISDMPPWLDIHKKENLDAMAAYFILKRYIDSKAKEPHKKSEGLKEEDVWR